MKILVLLILFLFQTPLSQEIRTEKKVFLKKNERSYLKSYKKSRKKIITESDVFIRKGNEYEKADDLKSAIAEYKKALDVDYHFAGTWYEMGCATFQMGDYLNAVNQLSTAIQNDTLSAESFYARGNANFKAGNYKSAYEDYSSAVQLNPKDADFYFNRALTGFKLEIDSACADLIRAKKLGDKKAEALFISTCR